MSDDAKVEVKQNRKLALLRITPEVLVEICKPTDDERWFRVIADGLPADAKMVGVGKDPNWFYDPTHHVVSVIVHSEQFEEVLEGHLLPVLNAVQFERRIVDKVSA